MRTMLHQLQWSSISAELQSPDFPAKDSLPSKLETGGV